MKTILIAINSKYVHLNLAIRSMNAFMDNKLDTLEFNINTDIVSVFGDILAQKPDCVMFSCYIWNIDYVLKLSADLKKALPNLKVVLGGPEVSFDAKTVAKNNPHIDYILCGECEELLPKFIDKLEQNQPTDGLLGVVTKNGNGDDSYNLLDDVNKLRPVSEIYFDTPKNKIYYYETTRGCPFSCSYCLSGSIKDTTRYLDLERVYADIEFFAKHEIPLVKLVDRTFNANKARAKAIIRYIRENSGVTSYHFEVGADILDDEIIELLNTAPHGKFQLEAGVQSCNEKTLETVVRTANFDKIASNTKKIIEAKNVHMHLDLIAGLPYENFESFGRSINKLYELDAHHLQLGFLKLLKGSKLALEAEKYEITYRDYPPYEVISTADISAQELMFLKLVEELVERYYNADCGRTLLNRLLSSFETPFDMLCAIARDFHKKGYLSRPMNIVDRLDVLLEFCLQRVENDVYIELCQLALVDVLKYSAKGAMPQNMACILDNADIKEHKNKLLADEKVTFEQFKKGKFVLTKSKIYLAFNDIITTFDRG